MSHSIKRMVPTGRETGALDRESPARPMRMAMAVGSGLIDLELGRWPKPLHLPHSVDAWPMASGNGGCATALTTRWRADSTATDLA